MSTPNPGTSLSVTTDRLWSLGLYYQLLNGRLEESRRVDDEWIRDAHLSVSPVDGTPLASVTYEDGREVRSPLILLPRNLTGMLVVSRVLH